MATKTSPTSERTGLVLPQGRLDVNGIEEISGIFSSPRKSSPLKKVSSVHGTDDDDENNVTPKQTRSTRKTPARSASPRKSGISGTARRSNAIDILNQNSTKRNQIISPRVLEKTPATNVQPALQAKSPFTNRQILRSTGRTERQISQAEEEPVYEGRTHEFTTSPRRPSVEGSPAPASDVRSLSEQRQESEMQDPEFEPLPPMYDDAEEGDNETVEQARPSHPQQKEQMTANSRRKRRSDAIEHDYEPDVVSSPAAKRAKRISNENVPKKTKQVARMIDTDAEPENVSEPVHNNDTALAKGKENVSTMSVQQQDALSKVVARIRSRPGQKKSLYVLRREGRGDNAVQTRSGRVSVKPLAYWRNERCVYGSPNGPTLADGARFPLNSIKEIIRTEESTAQRSKKGKKQKRQKEATNGTTQSTEDNAEIDDTINEDVTDPDAEPWETEIGTIKGPVAIWDQKLQTPIREEEEVDIAYAADAIQKEEVKGSDFRYAKLLSTRFFGSGLVELPAGAIKKPKNSRKMHMSFFVAKGRVTVSVGSLEGPENRFSIGKGGFWQVPRGNQYSIENEHEKTAVVFFSQACEPGPWYGE